MSTESADLAFFRLFASLTPLEQARLYPELEPCSFAPGEPIYQRGDPPDALYLIRSGVVELRPEQRARPVAVLGPGEGFGETALLADTPRYVGAYAATPVELWRLRRERFAELVEANPRIALAIAGAIAQRLSDRTQLLARTRARLEELADRVLDQLPPADRQLLERLSVLDRISPDVAVHLTGRPDAFDVLRRLEPVLPLIRSRDPSGAYEFGASLRAALRRRLEAAEGPAGVSAWQARAAGALVAAGEPAAAVAAYLAAGLVDEAERLASAEAEARRQAGGDAAVSAWLDELPPQLFAAAPALVALRTRVRAELSGGAEAEEPARVRIAIARATAVRVLAWALAALCLALAWSLPPPPGLSPAGLRVLGTVVAAVPLFLLDLLPDFAVALLLLVGWAAAGLSGRTVLAGFASSSWFLVVAALGIGAAVARSGLLYRAALWSLDRLPAHPLGLAAALAGLGLVFSPAMPNLTARAALAAPVALEIAEALRLPPRSPAAVRLGLATFLGFGQMGTLFLSGTTGGLLVYGLLPPEARAEVGWVGWLVGALPLHAVLLALSFGALLRLYRPEPGAVGRPAALAEQRRLLGSPGAVERAAGLALALVIAAFVGAPLVGVDPVWPALVGVVALVGFGALDASAIRSGMNWPLLLFLGVMSGLGDVFAAAGLSDWLGAELGRALAPLTASPTPFLLVATLLGTLLSVLVRWQAAAAVLTVVLLPLTGAVGVHPWVLAICVLAGANTWLFPQQSTGYLAVYHGSEGRLFSHEQARPLALAYPAFVLVGVLVSIPWWRALGLVR